MISETASRFTVYARGTPIPTQRRYRLLCGPFPVRSLAPAPPIHVPCHRVVVAMAIWRTTAGVSSAGMN